MDTIEPDYKHIINVALTLGFTFVMSRYIAKIDFIESIYIAGMAIIAQFLANLTQGYMSDIMAEV
jgi:hypothetical protein